MKGTLILSAAFCFTAITIQAQAPTRISGKVVDAETGQVLVGATVVVDGAKTAARTDVEGNFFLPLETGKKYTIRVTNVGYQAKEISDINPAERENNTINISMVKDQGQMKAVVVTSVSARRESVASLYTAQKNSASISDGISSELIRKSPDRNTGEVLKRVSGASVQDNKFVVIRGLSERYNVSMLNNSILPSTEPDKKAFSFDIIPASLVENMVIYKSATPDLPGDFSGGAIKISTKDYPARKLSEFSFSTSFNSLTTFKDFYKGQPEGSLDFLGIFDNKTRLIPQPYYKRRGADFFNTDPGFKREVTKMFPNTFGYEAAGSSLPNFSFQYTGGNTALIKSNKLGYIYSIGYGAGRRVVARDRNDFDFSTADKQLLYNYNTSNYDVRNNISALLNLTYSYGQSKISWKNLFNNDFTKTVALRNGVNQVNYPSVFYYRSLNSEAMNNGLFNSVVEGLHKVNKSWTIDWATSYGLTYRNQPDQRILTLRTDYNNSSDYFLSVGYENSPEIRNAGRVYSFLFESVYGGNVNATKEFRLFNEVQKFKTGTYNYYRNRNVEVDALGYGTVNAVNRPVTDGKATDFSSVLRPENIDRYNLSVASIPSNSTDYTGQIVSNAGYAMLDNKFSERARLTWGARVERYYQSLQARKKADVVRDNFDVLPSMIFTYAASRKANIRIAGSQAINRPEFRELADYNVYDYENYISVKGNPNLVRSKNTNADLRYEYFPASGEIISASLFYKYFKNPIEQVNQNNDQFSFANAEHATSYGVEVELRKRLNFINSGLFERLTVYANAAYIKGAVRFGGITSDNPLQGQSPYLINGGISYTSANDDFSINALYNKVGPRLRFRAALGAALNIYERPRDVVDVQISKKFAHKKLEAKLTVSDILAQPFAWYYKFEPNPSNINYNAATDKIINSFRYGATTTLSLKYNFGK